MVLSRIVTQPRSAATALLLMGTIAAVAATLLPPRAHAQGPSAGEVNAGNRIHLGIEGGLTFSTFHGGDYEASPTPGFHLGVSARYGIGNSFFIRPGVTYVQKGGEFHYDGGSPWEVSIDYIELPLLLHYRFGGGRLAPYLQAGPSLGIHLSSYSHRSSSQPDFSPDDWVRFTRETDFAAVLGGGLAFNLPYRSFLLELRYSLGLTSVFEGQTLSGIRNGALSIMLGVTI